MASALSSDDDLFDRIRKTADPEVVSERQKAVEARVREQYERAQRQLAELIDSNQTLPVTISDIRVNGLKKTRAGFLQGVFAPALSEEKQRDYTLKSAMDELQTITNKLHQFGIFHPTIPMYLDASQSSANGRVALSATLNVQERGHLQLKSGLDVGNIEGGGYMNATIRNMFGGAESLYASASSATSTADVGARARSTYELTLATPIAANPNTIADIGGFASSRSNQFYASHDEASKGVRAGLKFLSNIGEHEIGYSGVLRQVTNLADDASTSVRRDAGDSVKSSITHTITRELRDNKLLPTRGTLFRNTTEIAGFGGLGGDVSFLKNSFEAQGARSLPMGISVSAGLRGGLLYPLSMGFGENSKDPKPSRINDRFFLGGATDVRGFRENGIGPRDGNDSVGGDVFLAGVCSVFFPLPRLGPDSPFRFHVFANGGRLVGLQKNRGSVGEAVVDAVKELGVGYPSIAAGFGLVYAHPVARLELNFALPIVKRAEEKARKGLQFGVGINFL